MQMLTFAILASLLIAPYSNFTAMKGLSSFIPRRVNAPMFALRVLQQEQMNNYEKIGAQTIAKTSVFKET